MEQAKEPLIIALILAAIVGSLVSSINNLQSGWTDSIGIDLAVVIVCVVGATTEY